MEKSLPKNKHWLKDLLSACWGVINFTRKAILNIIFLVLAFIIIAGIAANSEAPGVIEDNSILKLNLSGSIVEQKTFVDPYNEVLMGAMGNNNQAPETVLSDVLKVIKKAETDNRISALLLDLHGLSGGGMSKLQEIGEAITAFKANSNKPVIAYGDYYSQTQYYLASHADNVVLHPMGAISMDGFGRYRMYYKSALEKLKVNAHIFRVGTFKSAVEPYIRDDMSEPAKEANQQWLGDLWQQYKTTIATNREVEGTNFDETLTGFLAKFKEVDGNFAQFALQNNWVDQLMTRQQFDQYLDDELKIKSNVVTMASYKASMSLQPDLSASPDKVGIVIAQGTIYNGKRNAGEIGGDSTAKLLKQARLDKSVKAVVLRVDSPGGSAFASEIIRNEIEALKKAGKPVIASMSSLAASGGYWISASADEIWASPSTITGSIGIFGMFMTFEDSLSYLGINTDGVATTEMAGISATRKLDPQMAQVIQTAIESGYDQFLNLVATERNMSVADVDKIAQGRVWSGAKAKELGLVDNLGSYSDAIDAAAAKAELAAYGVKVITKPLSPVDQLMMDLFAAYGPEPSYSNNSTLLKVLAQIGQELTKWTEFNDPAGAYIYCLECEAL